MPKNNLMMSQINSDLNVQESGEMNLIEDQSNLPELSQMQIRVQKPLKNLSKGYKAGTIKRLRKHTIDSYRTKGK